MDIDIQKELAGKNPARVAPQIRRNVKIQKQRVQMHLIMTLFFLALASARLIFSWVPLWVQLFALIALPFTALGIYGDGRLLKYQKQKLKLIEEILNSRTES
ncbi:hypothetical protein Pan241w_19390 [Gimesia alba]|uniref:2TM domain-containing protein n=1 Tax=Gimesia alba TaxID=2527973 RepID=A0A517RDB2_9PLAN|nr:hypothetical protein [Gimesia alba]QDT41871.1 hypothetical protein Pan241w_19390 [Gimesia alba]